MKLSLTKSDLKDYLKKQVSVYFPDGNIEKEFKNDDIDRALDLGLERLENCFKHIKLESYSSDNGQTYFSHLHSDQYSQFLYYFSNSLWTFSQNKEVCDKIVSLNKCLSGMFFSYKGVLPDIFLISHPVGTVLGNAKYSDFLVVMQNVTVNTGNEDGPVLGKGLFLAAGAKIIGTKPIGDRVSIGVDVTIYNQEIKDDKIVYRNMNGELIIKERKKDCKAQECFRTKI